MYHTGPPTDKTIRELYMNSSRVAACALRNEQTVRAHRPGRPMHYITLYTVKQISNNEIYLLIKYIKIVLWRVAKRLSYIQDARCLKFKPRERAFKQFKSPVLNVLTERTVEYPWHGV